MNAKHDTRVCNYTDNQGPVGRVVPIISFRVMSSSYTSAVFKQDQFLLIVWKLGLQLVFTKSHAKGRQYNMQLSTALTKPNHHSC